MEQDIARLVNGMRTSVIGKPDSQEVLSIADVLESVLRRQEKELGDLHGTLSQVQRELATVRKELAEKTEALTLAEEKLRILIAFRFGRSSERWKPDMTLQRELFNEAEMLCSSEPEGVVDEVPEAGSAKNTKTSTAPLEEEKLHGGRKPFPENLPRVEELRDLSESEKICSVCGKPLERIGEDVSERLQMKPIEWYVQRTVRPKYACSCADGGVHEAPVPNQIVPKSMIGETVAAQIIASKYCEALPFFRQ
jgi:transposase